MNELPDEFSDELRIWRALSQIDNSCAAEGDPSQSPAVVGRRTEVVSQCLGLLNQIWPPNSHLADDESIDEATNGTPGAAWSIDANTTVESSAAAEEVAQPKRFGRFLIDRQLGRGGHGLVFRAIDPMLERPVAIKIPNPDSLASSELRRRFVEESRTLARLEHPNLLPILEAGTVGPVCYLVTPFCAGPSLAEWLRRQEGPVACELAARLVRDLARTVGYVHSRGVLHRDIKLSNVLLEPVEHAVDRNTQPSFDFVAKLADFGLAKLVSRPATRTLTGEVIGTPAYMAPEQAEGRHADVGVATDVYALGAMLYELLTARPPYRGESIVETLRLISEGRLTPPGSLRADLPRDLGAICLKCLEFEPGRRYRSADDLADDLTASLECRPVQARACGPLTRLAKWGRRKPLVASLAASIVVLALAGLTVVGWQWRRAEAHRQQAEETFSIAHGAIKHLHDVLFEENQDTYDTPEYYALQKTVLDAALPYYEQLLAIKSSDPELRVDFADVFMRLGHMAEAQGSRAEALEWFNKAAHVWQHLVEEDPPNREYRYFLGKIQGRVGGLLWKENDPTAAERLQQAVAIQEQLIHESPSFRRARWELSGTLCKLVRLHLDRDELDQATGLADRAIEVLVEIPPKEREARPMLQRILAEAYLVSAEAGLTAGKLVESNRRCSEAVELCRRLVAQNQDMPSSANMLAQSLRRLACLSAKSGHSEQSIEHYCEAIEVGKTLASRYPMIPNYRQALVKLYAELGKQYCRQSRFEDAIRLQHEAIRFFEQQDSESPNIGQIQLGLAEAYLASARARNAMADLPGAVDDCETAMRFFRQVVQQHGDTPTAANKLAYSLRFLAALNARMSTYEKAAQLYREAVDLQHTLVAKNPDNARYQRELADYYIAFATLHRELRNCEQASQLYQQARELLEQLVKDSPAAADFQLRLIRCNYLAAYNCELLGRLDEATAALNRGRDLVLSLAPEAKREFANEAYQLAAAFKMGAHVRTAAGEEDGGIENEWHRELQRTSSP